MISEEMIKNAAAEADQAIRDSLPAPAECEHEFSPLFQRKMCQAFRTALTTVASGTLALFKCADKKGAYRNSAENLKSELSEYCAKTGRYSSVEDSERNAIFSEAMERIIKQGYSKIASLENNASGKS